MNAIKQNYWLSGLLLFAFLLRLFLFYVYPDQNFPDAGAYRTMGVELFSGDLVSNHIYMPLYPILTYIAGSEGVQILIDIILSVVMVYIIYALSMQLFNNKASALLAAFIATLYPHFIFYSISGLTETLFTVLLLFSFLSFYKNQFTLAIVILALAILVRPTLDLINPLLVFIFGFFVFQNGYKKSIKHVFIYTLVYFTLMAPWWIYQNNKYGDFVRLTLADGVVLYSGNNSMNVTGGGVGRRNGVSDADLRIFNNIKDPIERNNAMKEEAFNYIIDNPTHFIKMAVIKLVRFWRLWPYTEHYQQWYIIASSLLSYGIVLIFSIGFIIKHSREKFLLLLPIFILIMYLSVVHMVTIGSIRYRFPLEPFLIIFASYYFVDLTKNFSWLNKIQDLVKYLNK